MMGDHVLFANTSTAKRFPFLASIPQHELAAMFSVPPVDRVEEKRQELLYCEPYVDQRIVFRQSAVGKKPFVPCNPSQAVATLEGTKESLFVGTYNDFTESQRELSITHKKRQADLHPAPFSKGRSAVAAGELLHNQFFLNSVDTEIAQKVKEMTMHRIKAGREALGGSGYGKLARPPSKPNTASGPAKPKISKGHYQRADEPRPMTGTAAPSSSTAGGPVRLPAVK